MISDSIASRFRRLGSSSARLSYSTLFLGQATNAWAMETSTDDVSTLSSLGGVVRTMGIATNALQPRMIRTC
jgi:hypothetical protein